MPGFIHPLKPGLMGAKLLWLYQQIRDLGLHLFGSDITVSFFQCTAQKTKEEGGGGLKGCYCKQREQGKHIDILNEHWLERKGRIKTKVRFNWRRKVLKENAFAAFFSYTLSADRLCGPEKAACWSASHGELPYAGQMLSKYRVCLKAGATVCASPVFCSQRKHISVDMLAQYSYFVAVLPKDVPSSFAKIIFPVSLSFFFVTFSASLQSVPLFLGLVVRWPSTHEQLDLWPWRDLSPLLPNHTHRWEEWCLCILLFLLLERSHIIPVFRS